MAAASQQREALRAEFARPGAEDYTAWLEDELLGCRARRAETPRQRARRVHQARTMTEDLAALCEAVEAAERR